MKDVEHWGVDIRINGERVLTIESNCLSGIDNIDDYRETVIECARHLLAFIGAEYLVDCNEKEKEKDV